jgi:metacaspase-1
MATAKGISLHVGLNAVDPTHYQGWDGQLAACEQDAKDMQKLANGRGYQSKLMLTRDATVKGVAGAIAAAAKALGPGDTFFITYSGHGGQVPDRNGDESKAETDEIGEFPDRYDETWVLYDRMLIDDELFELWSRFQPKVRIIMLSDSCHSGTIAKPLPWDSPTDEPASRRIPLEVEEQTYEHHKRLYDKVQLQVPTRTASSIKATVVLISGCMDNQTSADGRVNGRFTGRLLTVWDGGRFKGTLDKLQKAIVAGMPPNQTPNLYVVGPANRSFTSRQAFTI